MKFKDNDKAIEEIECYMTCLKIAVDRFEDGRYLDAYLFLENAARSAKELHRLQVRENETVVLFGTVLNGRNNHDRT